MAKDAQLKGPHAFSLQRLQMIFRVLLRNEAPDPDIGGSRGSLSVTGMQHGNIMPADADCVAAKATLSTLVSLKLLVLVRVAGRWGGSLLVCRPATAESGTA